MKFSRSTSLSALRRNASLFFLKPMCIQCNYVEIKILHFHLPPYKNHFYPRSLSLKERLPWPLNPGLNFSIEFHRKLNQLIFNALRSQFLAYRDHNTPSSLALLLQPIEKQGFIFSPKPNPTAASSHYSLNPACFFFKSSNFLKILQLSLSPFSLLWYDCRPRSHL